MTGWPSVAGVSAVVLAATVVAVPRAALGGQGDDGVSLAGLRWSQAIEVASGNAHRGPWRQNDSEFDFVDDAAVAVNDQGFVAVAWADLPTHDIFLQVYGPEGEALLDEPSNIFSADGGAEFSGPVVPHESGGFADAPRVVFDGAGVLHLVYAESLGGPDGAPYVDSDGQRQSGAPQLMYTRAAAGGMDFTPARPVFEGEAGDNAVARSFPFLRADARGHLHLAWERFAEFPGRPRGLGYARSEDGGDTFSTPVLVPGLGGAPAEGVNGSQQGLLASKLAVSASGRVALANSLFVGGERSEVRVVSAGPGS